MKKKKIKKKVKIKFIPVLILLLLGILIYFLVSFFMNVPIKNIYISGNNILTDQEIIELASLEDYPGFLKVSSNKIEKRIKSSDYVKNVKVRKKLISVVEIKVEEYKLLYVNNKDNKVVVDIDNSIPYDKKINSVPILVNYVPDTVRNDFIKSMQKVNTDILANISEIEYSPNDYDKKRFLLYMNDGNEVYLTLTRFKLINKYNQIYPTLDGKKGILYLDSGNHFEIKG